MPLIYRCPCCGTNFFDDGTAPQTHCRNCARRIAELSPPDPIVEEYESGPDPYDEMGHDDMVGWDIGDA
jgi:hypothetical protein